MTASTESAEPEIHTEEAILDDDSRPSRLGTAEPWAGWETRLCLWSIAIGIAGLIVLGLLINLFVLPSA